MSFRLIILFICALLIPRNVYSAETAAESEYDELLAHIKKPYFSLGTLFQGVADYQNERTFSGNNGFSIANMRLLMKGELENRIGYSFQTNFINSPAVLDAKMYVRFTPALQVDMGLFKAPFSKEFLIPAADIDFVNRAQVVDALAPKRQLGMMVNGWMRNRSVYYGIGLFNGNGYGGNVNDDNDFLYAGRLAYFPDISGFGPENSQLEVGINAGFSKDTNVNIGGGFIPAFKGERKLYGADFRLQSGDMLISGEFITAEFDVRSGRDRTPKGFALTAGYRTTDATQFLLRWDALDRDAPGGDSEIIIIGCNYLINKISAIQINYIIPRDNNSPDYHQVLINMQVAF